MDVLISDFYRTFISSSDSGTYSLLEFGIYSPIMLGVYYK